MGVPWPARQGTVAGPEPSPPHPAAMTIRIAMTAKRFMIAPRSTVTTPVCPLGCSVRTPDSARRCCTPSGCRSPANPAANVAAGWPVICVTLPVSGSDIQPQLDRARAAHRRAAEEGALERVFLVQDVVDVDLWSQNDATHGKGVARARSQNEIGRDVRVLVESEQPRAVRRVRGGGADESRPVGAGR